MALRLWQLSLFLTAIHLQVVDSEAVVLAADSEALAEVLADLEAIRGMVVLAICSVARD